MCIRDSRKGKSVSKPEWVWNLTHQAHALGIPVFMKEDLIPIMGEAQMVQELSLIHIYSLVPSACGM